MAANKRKKLSIEERNLIYNMFDGHCAYCGCNLNFEGLTIDHIKPLNTAKGTDTLDNMFPACFNCNHEKSNLTLEKYRAKKGIQNKFFFEVYRGKAEDMRN